MSYCISLTLDYDEYRPPNCPNCGRFMGFSYETNLHTCSCNGFLHHRSTGDAEMDAEYIEFGWTLPKAICKKPDGWKEEWGLWLLPEKVHGLATTVRNQDER